MRKVMNLLIGIGSAVVLILLVTFAILSFRVDETKVPRTVPTVGAVTSAPVPAERVNEEKDKNAPTDISNVSREDGVKTDGEEDVGEATEPKVTEPEEATSTMPPEVTDTLDVEEVIPIEPIVIPSVSVTPTVTPSPTVMPTPKPIVRHVREFKMGDNVWYRLAEDGTLYVTGTGATWGYNTYIDEENYIRGDFSGIDKLLKLLGTKHIVIEEGITKLGSWSLAKLAGAETITFPSTLMEIGDFCFNGTGKSVDTVWIGLDKNKVKLSDKAFFGAVYQTEEDLKKPTSTPTLAPTPTSLPIAAQSFYKALVAEAGIKTDVSDKEPYSVALIRAGILESGEVKKADEKLTNQEAALLLYRTALKYNCKNNADVVENAKKYNRISDKISIIREYEDAVYFCFGNGIMPGKSNGEYSYTRSFDAKCSLLEADGLLYCKRLFDVKERVPMSPDAQVIRTSDLPVQAKLYPYILESFPNVYYDTNYLYMYNLETDDRAYPECPGVVGFMESWCTPSTVEEFSTKQPERCKIYTSETDYLDYEEVGMEKVVERYRDVWEQQARRYLKLVFNFDYRTVRKDTAWQEELKSLNAFYTEWEKGTSWGSCGGVDGIDEWMNNFLDNAEKYHTVVECSDVDFDMSTLFYSELFSDRSPYTIRVHLRYKITTDAEPGFSDMAEVVPVRAYGAWSQFESFGEWKDTYAELTFDTNSFDRAGIGGVRILEYNVNDAIRYHFDPKKYVK